MQAVPSLFKLSIGGGSSKTLFIKQKRRGTGRREGVKESGGEKGRLERKLRGQREKEIANRLELRHICRRKGAGCSQGQERVKAG